MNTFEIVFIGLVALVIFGSIFYHELTGRRTRINRTNNGDYLVHHSIYSLGGAEYSVGSDAGSCSDGGGGDC